MSFYDYEEERLNRANMAEELARFYHSAYKRLAPKYGRKEAATPWAELSETDKALCQAIMLDLVDQRVIFPASVVSQLRMELDQIKNAWKTLVALVSK